MVRHRRGPGQPGADLARLLGQVQAVQQELEVEEEEQEEEGEGGRLTPGPTTTFTVYILQSFPLSPRE